MTTHLLWVLRRGRMVGMELSDDQRRTKDGLENDRSHDGVGIVSNELTQEYKALHFSQMYSNALCITSMPLSFQSPTLKIDLPVVYHIRRHCGSVLS